MMNTADSGLTLPMAHGDGQHASSPNPPSLRLASSKIQAIQLERLAVVYIRQSSPQQVLENRESTARQYAFADYATLLGWPRDRILIIDEDLGKTGRTTEGRTGFQRLVTEVTLDHVGLVLGLEMSRLARSSKDWHILFELCAVYRTFLADEDGVYDPNDANDRLVLGLKGIISEMELHMMRNRMERGRLNKAARGALFHFAPRGYVILSSGDLDFDPDEQARLVVQLVFDKFDELGSLHSLFRYLVRQDIRLPVRPHHGPNKGQLEWRRPTSTSLGFMLHHPIYAGAYAYPRSTVDPRSRLSPGRKPRLIQVPIGEWKILLKDCLPAYITWDRYLKNQQRLEENQSKPRAKGTPRVGAALLPGLLVCGSCDRRMRVSYRTKHQPYYLCVRHTTNCSEKKCSGVKAQAVEQLVSQQLLRALEPAGLELSLQASRDVQRERERLTKHWKQRRDRARYDAQLAERRYRAVDPDNRLVAATLEQRWEETLREQRNLQDEYDRFLLESPLDLSAEEQSRIASLANDIPALWNAPVTTNADRQAILRCLVDRVVVHVKPDSEYVDVAIHWAGDYVSRHEITRPVATYAQLRDRDQLMDRIVTLRKAGHTEAEIATVLNAEGFVPPMRRSVFSGQHVHVLLLRCGLGDERRQTDILEPGEWWLKDLADQLKTSRAKLRSWILRGWAHARTSPIQGLWIVWADDDELARLRELGARTWRGVRGHSPALTTPKTRA